MCAAFGLFVLVLRQNTFAGSTITVEAGQRVTSTGPAPSDVWRLAPHLRNSPALEKIKIIFPNVPGSRIGQPEDIADAIVMCRSLEGRRVVSSVNQSRPEPIPRIKRPFDKWSRVTASRGTFQGERRGWRITYGSNWMRCVSIAIVASVTVVSTIGIAPDAII